jgi:hypothetical protein
VELNKGGESTTSAPVAVDPANVSELQLSITLAEQGFEIDVLSVEIVPLSGADDEDSDISPEPSPGADDSSPSGTPDPRPTPEVRKSIVQGTVLFENGTPVFGARVRVVSTGDSDSTDSSGRYRIETELDSGTLEISLSYGSFTDSISIGRIPDPPIRAEVNLSLVEVDAGPDQDGGLLLELTASPNISRR